MVRRLVIDRDRCENNGYCRRVAGTLIKQAADGSPEILVQGLGVDQEIIARLAVAACPMGALRLEAENT